MMLRTSLALALCLALSACGSAPSTPNAPEPTTAPTTDAPSGDTDADLAVDDEEDVERIAPHPGNISDEAKKIVADPDRTDDDKKLDERRHPAELLTFIGLKPGMKVADLGAGGGYTTELLVRAVGPDGTVYAQNNQHTLDKFVSESWPARLKRKVNTKIIRVDREYDAPLPPEAKDLDAVTIIFSYHDVLAQGHDIKKLNDAVFAALKPGGVYIIADHSAQPSSVKPGENGAKVASDLHRIPEALVRQQVSAAGFEIASEAQFLRDTDDDLTSVSYKIDFNTDRFVLKFLKPKTAGKTQPPVESAE